MKYFKIVTKFKDGHKMIMFRDCLEELVEAKPTNIDSIIITPVSFCEMNRFHELLRTRYSTKLSSDDFDELPF